MIYAKIAGTGSYLPEKRLGNADLDPGLNTSDEWIFERTGIRARRVAGPHDSVSSMAKIAAEKAIEAAGITKDDIDLIIVATCSQENFFPGAACVVQKLLEIEAPIPAFDITAACAGFVFALVTGEQFVKTGAAKNVLVIGAETMTRTLDWTDRSTCVLFGDGAGAVVLQPSKDSGILCSKLHAKGAYKDLLNYPNGMISEHLAVKPVSKYIQMRGNEVFKIAVKYLEEVVEEILDEYKISKEEIQWLVPHQANYRIIAAMAKKLDMDLERVILTIEEHGNTSAASIPLALDTGIRDGRIKRGDKILLESFGGGLAWGAALIQY